MRTSDTLLLAEVRQAVKAGLAREIRQRSGLSQADVARAIGVTDAAVCRWEGGSRAPTGRAALRYARLLRQLAAQRALTGGRG